MLSKTPISSWKKAITGSVFVASLVVAVVAGSAGIAAAQGFGHGSGPFTFSSASGSSASGSGWPGFNSAPKRVHGDEPHHSASPKGFWHGPSVKGTVTGTPTSSAFTLQIPGCATAQTITTSPSTFYFAPGTGLTLTGVATGEQVIVDLNSGSTTLSAKSVTILLTKVSGVVANTSPLVITDYQGFEHTIDVSSSTTYTPTGATIGQNDNITAFGVIGSDHVSLDALAIRVWPATTTTPTGPAGNGHLVVGVVATGETTPVFTVNETGGATEGITVNGSTKYFEPGATTQPTGVTPGQHVAVILVPGASTPTAAKVFIFLNQLDGTVVPSGIGTSSFVIMDHQGFWDTVDVDGTTVYSPTGTTLSSSLANKHVAVFGSVTDSVFDAQFVYVFTFPAFNSNNWDLWQKASSSCPVVTGTGSTTNSNPTPTWPPNPNPGANGSNGANHVVVTGTVQSVNTMTDLIVVTQGNGSTTSVLVDGATTYRGGSTSDPNLQTVAGLNNQTPITVFGTPGPGSEVTASQVLIGTSGGWGNAPGWGNGSGNQESGHAVPTPSVHFGGPPSFTSGGAGRSDGGNNGANGSGGANGGRQSPFGGGQSGH